MTEDADNMPTMTQIQMNFGGNNYTEAHESVRSGVFGGYNQSGHMSF